MFRILLTTSLAIGLLIAGPAQSALKTYEIEYAVEFEPKRGLAKVVITWGKGAKRIREIRFRVHERMQNFKSNIDMVRDDPFLTLENLADGTTLSYEVLVDNVRGDGEFDARITSDWALWRGDDLIPPAKLRQLVNTEADASLVLRGPTGWSFETPYREVENGVFDVKNPRRSFDRPTGWMVGGRIGVRTENIGGVKVAVAGPVNQNIRRMDVLAFLNWTLPAVTAVLPSMPERLLVVSANDGMWRGGLSAGNSLYLHAERPLLSGNGTSTILHELIHVASGLDSKKGSDWIVEGLAEYYALKLLRETGTITRSRMRRAVKDLREWSREAGSLSVRHSTGPTTAKAALIMRELDQEIQAATNDEKSLDDVFMALVEAGQDVDLKKLKSVVENVSGNESNVLADLDLD